MLLMIDNYDSFTYNVVQYLGELGAEVKVVRNDELSVAQIAALNPERIVVSPGPCTPNRPSTVATNTSNCRKSAKPSRPRWTPAR